MAVRLDADEVRAREAEDAERAEPDHGDGDRRRAGSPGAGAAAAAPRRGSTRPSRRGDRDAVQRVLVRVAPSAAIWRRRSRPCRRSSASLKSTTVTLSSPPAAFAVVDERLRRAREIASALLDERRGSWRRRPSSVSPSEQSTKTSSGCGRHRDRVDLDVRLRPEGARDHRSVRMGAGLLRRSAGRSGRARRRASGPRSPARASPSRTRYARESPTWPIQTTSFSTSATVIVVPMPEADSSSAARS